jgi:hypothetical protein
MRPLKKVAFRGLSLVHPMETIFKFQQIDMKAKGTSQ